MSTCIERALVDAHFRGAITPTAERRLRAHVTDCAACKKHYRRHQLLASLDPEASSPEDRLARGLGFSAPAAPQRRLSKHLALAASALALAALLFFVVRSPEPKDDGFTARGSVAASTSATPSVSVYRVRDRTLLSATTSIEHDDELAFAYANPTHKPYLMIFGVDETGRVYWFYPAWNAEAENPMAFKMDPAHVTQQLPEAIRHPFAGARLTIHGLFLDAPLTVRDVEAALRAHRLDGMPGAVDHTTTFEVTR